MLEQYDKHMQVCGAAFITMGDAVTVTSFDGCERSIQVDGSWEILPVKDAEFSEEQSKEGVYSQKFSARLADCSHLMEVKMGLLLRKKGLLRLDYTNGERIVVGDEEFPVLVSIKKEGSPLKLTLSMKRSSSSPSRQLQSL